MAQRVEGTVVSISEDGHLVTDITAAQLHSAPTDERVSVECDGHVTQGIFGVDHSQPEATLLALIGASGNLEIAIVGENISLMLGIGVGEQVRVEW